MAFVWSLRVRALLDNQRAGEVHGLKLPVFLDMQINRLRQPVKPKKVLILIHLREMGVFQLLILRHVDATLKDGLLYPLADRLTGFGPATYPTAGVGSLRTAAIAE